MLSPFGAIGNAGTAIQGGEKDASKDAAEQVLLNLEERAPLSVTGFCFDRHVKTPPTFAAKVPLHFDGDIATSPLREFAAKTVLAYNVSDLKNSIGPPSDKIVEAEVSPLPFDISGLHFERDMMSSLPRSNHENDGAASNMTFKPLQEVHFETLLETREFLSA